MKHKIICGMCGAPACVTVNVVASTVGEKVRRQASGERTHFCPECIKEPLLFTCISGALRALNFDIPLYLGATHESRSTDG